MKLHPDSEGPPCARMEMLLQQAADGTLMGWKKWYALSHAAKCFRCGNFLNRLRVTVQAIRDSKNEVPPEDAMARLRARIAELEKGT